MEFAILGPLEVRHEGRLVEVGGPRRRAVLAALLLRAGEPLSSDVLIQALWGENAPPTAAKALQVHVSRLRARLGTAATRLVTTPAGYRLDVAPDELDARRFERLGARARRERADGRLVDAAATLTAALELWRGSPLADLRYETFAQAEIARLEELRWTAVEERLDLELELGNDVLGDVERLALEAPLRERLLELRMRALYRAGRHVDALAAYRDVARRLGSELGLEPGPALRDLERAILLHDSSLSGSAGPAVRPPPAPPTATIGRESDLEALTAALAESHLVTLTGPGGVGKTRLAIELARRVQDRFPDGVRFVPLASIAGAKHLTSALAHAVGATTDHRDIRTALLTAVADEQNLLVIDNFEHVMSAAPLIRDLLDAGPGLTVVVTSRELLRLRGERAFPVEPLPVSSEDASNSLLEESPAVALFAARARDRDPSFRLTGENAAIVAELCARLDGLPLAIELVAARIGLLSLEQIAARLGEVMRSPMAGPRDAPVRQRTLRATVEWSVRLSTAREQDAFVRLAVFAGGCTIAAAERIAGTSLEVLDGLVAKNLLGHRGDRLTMLETVREYGFEQLRERPGCQAVFRSHAEWCLVLAREHSFDVLRGNGQAEQALEAEVDNLRQALTWAARNDHALHAELTATLRQFWWGTSRRHEGLAEVETALRAGSDGVEQRTCAGLLHARAVLSEFDAPDRRADAIEGLERFEALDDDAGALECLIALMELELHQGRWHVAVELGERAIRVARRSGQPLLIGRALLCRSFAEADLARARPLVVEAAEQLSRAGSVGELAMLLSNTASLAIYEEAYEDADELLDEALEVARDAAVADRHVAVIQGNRGLAALMTGRLDAAADAFRAELAHGRPARFAFNVLPEGLLGIAAVSAADGDLERAALLCGAAEACSDREVFGPDAPVLERVRSRFIEPARASLGEAAWNRAERAGRRMRPRDAVAAALETPRPRSPARILDGDTPASAD